MENSYYMKEALKEANKAYEKGETPIGAVIVKNKVKPLVFTADVIVANVMFGSIGLYTMFVVWLLDTYVITPLYNKYKEKYAINKEIDKRG